MCMEGRGFLLGSHVVGAFQVLRPSNTETIRKDLENFRRKDRKRKMWEQVPGKRHSQQEENPESSTSFLLCAELILPWLTSLELANISLTCKALKQIAKSITLHRSLDASKSLENLPIPFRNSVDHHPYAYFIYTPSQFLPSSASESFLRQPWGSILGTESVTGMSGLVLGIQNPDSGEVNKVSEDSVGWLGARRVSLVDESGESVSGCHCVKCEAVYSDVGFGCPCSGLEGLEISSECGPSCGCGLECGNRLTQRGISIRLKIVRDERKGWGLYADQQIQQGQFVCEYAGELLTTEEARRRQQIYDKLASDGQLSPALLVVREHLPSGKACLRINIDATRVGNVARFINHSCDGGNLSTALVRCSGMLLPRLCFFASKDINQDEELSFSYGDVRLRSNGLQCFCSSSCCFGVLPSENT